MYGEWLEVRDKFKDVLSNSPDKVIEIIKSGRFVPCLSVGDLDDWINPLKYSIYGEVGYTVWSFNTVRSFDVSESDNSFRLALMRMFLSVNFFPRISMFYVSGIGVVGLGLVADLNIDFMREFKRMAKGIEEKNQTSHSRLLRVRMKVIWLHKNVRTALQNALNRVNDLKTELQRQEKWQSNECGNIPNEIALVPGLMCDNLSASVVNKKANRALKQLIKCIVEKDEQGVRDTYNFYINLTNLKAQSTPKVETPTNVERADQLEQIDCGKGSIKDVVEALSNKFFVYAQKREDFFKLLASSTMMHNVLLVGPPGTGKTSMAISIVEALTGKNDECYEIVTANALWFRRNLVGGESLQKGEVSWSSGILIRAYNKADRVANGNYYVIIDEINRADVDKAFGEILTLMSDVGNTSAGKKILDEIEKEIRKFGDENSDKLDEDAKQFLRNLKRRGENKDEPLRRIRFIATMNEVDANNLFPIGEALTRRFLVFRIPYPCGADDVKMFLESEEFKEMKNRDMVTKVVSEEVNELRKEWCDELKKGKRKEKINFNISPASVKLALSLLKQIVEDNDDESSIRKKFLDALEASLGTTDDRILREFVKYKTQRLGNSQQPAPS